MSLIACVHMGGGGSRLNYGSLAALMALALFGHLLFSFSQSDHFQDKFLAQIEHIRKKRTIIERTDS